MANTLGFYNVPMFAQEALIWLQKALGMAGRVHRGFDRERGTFNRGDVINIRRPSTFTAQAAPGAAADITPDSVVITLDQWQEVRMTVTDKELAYTGDSIITDHIMPAAYALADKIDSDICTLYKDVPWFVDGTATPTDVTDMTKIWRVLFDNQVPMSDLHLMLNGERTAAYMALPAFSQWQGAGEAGVQTQQRGSLGMKFDMEVFSNQNVRTHTTTAITGITQAQVNANVAKGVTQLVIKDSDAVLAGTLAKGDTFVIAGNTQRYAVTADATAATNLITVNFTPPLAQAHVTNDNITIRQQTAKTESLAFNRGFAALAFARLPDYAQSGEVGAQFASVQDPVTGLAVRYRIGYDNTNSRIVPVLDVLYGMKTLNPNLAVRLNA